MSLILHFFYEKMGAIVFYKAQNNDLKTLQTKIRLHILEERSDLNLIICSGFWIAERD